MCQERVRVGDFCPDSDCDDYGKLQSEDQTNIIKFGKTKANRQRYKCKTCNKTFVETKGTIFYRRRTSEEEIIDTLNLGGYEKRRAKTLSWNILYCICTHINNRIH